jgi:hypothetical protein
MHLIMSKIEKIVLAFCFTNDILKKNDICSDIKVVIKGYLVDLYYDCIIKLNKEIVEDLFRYIADATTFSHVIFNGLPYYERTNMWGSDLPSGIERLSYDVDVECKGYWSGECESAGEDIINPKNSDKVSYVIKYLDTGAIIGREDVNDEDFIKKMPDYDSEKVLLVGYKKLIVRNPVGVNRDHRGSDHCKIKLKYHKAIIKKDYITLRELCDIFYKIKSHKWDNHYEMYCGVDVHMGKSTLTIEADFDHGS